MPEPWYGYVPMKVRGWGIKRVACELGCSHWAAKQFGSAGGPVPFKVSPRPDVLNGHEDWLREGFLRHRGNADVLRQGFAAE